MNTNPARIVIAGVASGVGKTTIATGLMSAFAARGLRVQGYKVGPDYIDPTYHSAATGRPSYNLDSWLSSQGMVHRRFDASMHQADIGIIEGAMGLFDGRKLTRDTASSAEIARLLDAPVLLVVDASRMGQSVAAVVSGFQKLDSRVRIAGVILNNVASADHEGTLKQAIAEWTDIAVLGSMRRDTLLVAPERHLGLIPASESGQAVRTWGETIERYLSVDEIERLARQAGPLPVPPPDAANSESALVALADALKQTRPLRIGIALDKAFAFYYPETLETFAQLGVESLFFSPLEDFSLPTNLDLLYFGGGFPEVYAAELARNTALLTGVRAAIGTGVPVYAECGGYMYLGAGCIDAAGEHHQLVGALPYTFQMGERRAQLGYREITTLRDTLLAPAGTSLRGHEFHWSRIVGQLSEAHSAYRHTERNDTQRLEGYTTETLLASYIHIPLTAHPRALVRLLSGCLSRRRAKA